jgi:hypothetical protein
VTWQKTLLAPPSAFWQRPGESRNPFASSYQRWPAHWSNSCSQAYHVTTAHAKQHEQHTGPLHDLRALHPPGIGCKNASNPHACLTQHGPTFMHAHLRSVCMCMHIPCAGQQSVAADRGHVAADHCHVVDHACQLGIQGWSDFSALLCLSMDSSLSGAMHCCIRPLRTA